MTSTVKTSQRWKQLAATGQVDADGILHTSLHFVETDSGHDFVVTVSAQKSINAGYWAGALAAAAHVYADAAGVIKTDLASIPADTLN